MTREEVESELRDAIADFSRMKSLAGGSPALDGFSKIIARRIEALYLAIDAVGDYEGLEEE